LEIAGSFPFQPTLRVLGSPQKFGAERLWTGLKCVPAKRRDSEMPILQILMVLIVVGVLLWLVNRYVPMQGTIKSILNAVVVICVVLWLLNIFGLFHSLSHIRVGT